MADNADRVIPATPRRLAQARREGLVPSASLPAWALAAAVAILLLPGPSRATVAAGSAALRAAIAAGCGAGGRMDDSGGDLLAVLVPTLGVVLAASAAGLGVRLVIDGFAWQPGRIAPRLTRIDPWAGCARLFSRGTFAGVAGAAVAVTVLVAVTIGVLRPLLGPAAVTQPEAAAWMAWRALVTLAGSAAAVAGCAWALARFRFQRRIRMTPQEFADEARSLQADPAIRLLLLKRRPQLSRSAGSRSRSDR